MDRISSLTRDLERLRRLDRDLVVFGASGHKYEARPWSLGKVKGFETQIKVDLPSELQEWLLRVGEGPGPLYGLKPFSFDRTGANAAGEFEEFLDIRADTVQKMLDHALAERPNKYGRLRIPMTLSTRKFLGGDGLLCLGDAGCSFTFETPLDGDFRGKIFYTTEETTDENDVELGGAFWPQGLCRIRPHQDFNHKTYDYRRSVADIFSFLDWIEYWLETETYLVENYRLYLKELGQKQEAIRIRLGLQSSSS